MPNSTPIVIYGAGGHGRVVLDILRSTYRSAIVGFLDSDPSLHGLIIDDVPVLGDSQVVPDLLAQHSGIEAVVAIGDNKARMKIAKVLLELGMPLANAVHPSAHVSPSARLGKDVTIAPGAIICAHAKIGNHVIVNSGAIVEHENDIGDGVHIAPGAKLAGRVTVGEGAFIGMGAVVIGNLTIGAGSIVGAGAVVLREVEPFSVVVGIPARPISTKVRDGQPSG
jgi:sugar O-acyltransferase (sialic acid O-acetyltransferase NeuD family)